MTKRIPALLLAFCLLLSLAACGSEAAQPSAEPTPEPTATPEPTLSPEPTPEAEPGQALVWIPQSGSKYHSSPSCSNMKNPTQVTVEEAESRGYEPCKKCYG